MVFRGSNDETPVAEMARRLRELAAEHGVGERREGARQSGGSADAGAKPAALSSLTDVRLALNVASCDQTPLVIVRGKSAGGVAALEKRLLDVAWSESLRGRFAYASTHDADELEPIADVPESAAFVVVAPDADASAEAIEKALTAALKSFTPKAKDTRRHVPEGERAGRHWETEIPVTDRGGADRGGADRRRPPR